MKNVLAPLSLVLVALAFVAFQATPNETAEASLPPKATANETAPSSLTVFPTITVRPSAEDLAQLASEAIAGATLATTQP